MRNYGVDLDRKRREQDGTEWNFGALSQPCLYAVDIKTRALPDVLVSVLDVVGNNERDKELGARGLGAATEYDIDKVFEVAAVDPQIVCVDVLMERSIGRFELVRDR